jgi:hypothetical protein
VPSGYDRPLYFAVVGTHEAIANRLGIELTDENQPDVESVCAAVMLSKGDSQWIDWIDFDRVYRARVVLTGDNFDAVTFHGQFKCFREEDGNPADLTRSVCRWIEPLH